MLRTPTLLLALGVTSLAAASQDGTAVAPPPSPPAVDTPQPDAPEAEPGAQAEDAKAAPEPEIEPSGPRLTTEADWQKWERLGGATLSPDGRWVAYSVSRNDGTSDLHLRVIATDSTEIFKEGRSPEFSSDGKWLAFSTGKSREESKKLAKQKKAVESKLGLFDLVRGETIEIDRVRSFEFSSDGLHLAMRRYSEKGEKNGADLVLRDLAAGTDTHFGRVTSFEWSDAGAWVAFTVGAPDQVGNGLRVYNAETGMLRTLDSAEADYVGMSWREDSADLAVMRKTDYEDDEDATFEVMAWRNVAKKGVPPVVFDHLQDDQFPADLRVVELAGLSWTDDGKAVSFGLKEWKERPAKLDEEAEADDMEDADGDSSAEEKAPADEKPSPKKSKDDDGAKSMRETLKKAPGVEIWHAQDIQIIPRQKLTAGRDERATIAALFWLDEKKLVQLENDIADDADLLEGNLRALGFDETPYEEEQRFSATLSDVYLVDAKTGTQERILERVKYAITGDPKGRYILFLRDDHLWSYDLDRGNAVNLTESVESPFINQENSSLTDEKPPYGIGGFTKDGRNVLLYDRFDIYSFPLKGGEATRLTFGADAMVQHRRTVVAADRDDEEFVDFEQGFYMSLYGERTKKSGYGHYSAAAGCTHLVWKDARIDRLRRAKDADVMIYSEQRFDDSPDYFVADARLDGAKEITSTNEFAEEFAWGRSELVDYESADGTPLQGALFYPADYDPAKTYPMVVYIYELRSQSLHQYASPSETNPYNTSVFSQEGYFVFQPDIVYRAQNPGLSAVDCVVPAVRKVLSTHQVDPERVGLFGHSWGAYQTAFIVTQTDLFAAGIAGAPLTNMMSMSMSIYWNSGQTDSYIFHESQGRMDRPFWNDVDTYIANSPIFSIENLNTPLLVTFGDEDGAVDWQQGIEMYNAARLAQRPYVMLVYPGENHGLRVEENRVDYHHRVREWFRTHVKGEEAPQWIAEGVSWLEQKEALEAIEKKK